MKSPHRSFSSSRLAARLFCALVGFSVLSSSSRALVFEYEELKATFDTTLSVGGLYRLSNPDPEFYGRSQAGGLQNSVNTDDGNLNYRKGWASQVFKGTHTLELKWRNYSALVSGYYFYDLENMDGERARTPLSDDAERRVGNDRQWLDMYVRGTFEVASRPLEVRFGRQVLNLGESTFLPNGINVINPIDVSRLRAPGSELREALLPVNMLKTSIGVCNNVTLEAFWLLEFRRTDLDPAGTYFSSNDTAARGGDKVYLGFGALSDRTALGSVGRTLDREGGNYNQYGADLHIVAPGLNDTDFGLYFANYHSRLPVLSARTPTNAVNTNLTAPLAQVFRQAGLGDTAAVAQAQAIYGLMVLAQTNPGAMTPTQYATLQSTSVQAAIGGARQIALLTAAATGRYFLEYPEDIKMIGVSFNTDLASTGIAWQGEVSYKHGVPLQIDDVELLFATLSALTPLYGAPTNQISTSTGTNYLGQYNEEISGYRREDVWTAQTTMTKMFGPMLGASQLTIVGEVGGICVPDLPSNNELRFEGSGTFTSGSQTAMNTVASSGTASALAAEPSSAFADPFSWGYQVVAKLEYNNLFAGVNFAPSIGFVHDVKGNTPMPLGNFVEGRKTINLAAEFTWQNHWALDVRYVNFFGAGRYNLLSDRDYVSSSLRYSF